MKTVKFLISLGMLCFKMKETSYKGDNVNQPRFGVVSLLVGNKNLTREKHARNNEPADSHGSPRLSKALPTYLVNARKFDSSLWIKSILCSGSNHIHSWRGGPHEEAWIDFVRIFRTHEVSFNYPTCWNYRGKVAIYLISIIPTRNLVAETHKTVGLGGEIDLDGHPAMDLAAWIFVHPRKACEHIVVTAKEGAAIFA